MKIFKLFKDNSPFKIKKSLELLGLNSNSSFLLNKISIYLFGKQGNKTASNKEKNFDINLDYEYYYPDFLKYGIDLNTDFVDWWKFNKVLNSILLDKNSNMYQIISFRCYEKPPKNPKAQEDKEHRFRMKLKQKYALKQDPQLGLEKLWGYLETKVGENKE